LAEPGAQRAHQRGGVADLRTVDEVEQELTTLTPATGWFFRGYDKSRAPPST